MEISTEQLLEMYLRTCLSLFSVKDFSRSIHKIGVRGGLDECKFYLESNPYVFALANGLYISRAGVFTDKFFSIKPTRKELDKGVFVPGHRCMPFVDPDMETQYLHFFYKGKELPQVVAEFDSVAAESFFFLVGEEFSPQYIMNDPANSGTVMLDADNQLPPVVKLTCVDLSRVIEKSGFKMGDRLLCRVVDWNASIVEVLPLVNKNQGSMRMRQEDVDRQQWFANLEDVFLKNFERIGPCCSIEEQLAYAFLENSNVLCVPECGSVEECIIQSEKIGLEQYGIETRIWRYGYSVPGIGEWNNFQPPQNDSQMDIEVDFFVPDYLIDAYIKNEFAQKRYDVEKVMNGLLPEDVSITEEDLLDLNERVIEHYAEIKKTYNHFADFAVVGVRAMALGLYEKVASLVVKIDNAKADLQAYPQQELVTVSQIYSHAMRMIEHIEMDPEIAEEERDELVLSIDGMLFNYDCIYNQIVAIIEQSKKNNFRAGI